MADYRDTKDKEIFVSTACLEGVSRLDVVLGIYKDHGIRNIELGSGHHYIRDVEKLLSDYSDLNFIIHNYFPPPEHPFIMNLASQDENVREKSLSICKKAVDLCKIFGFDLYSFHPGFRVETTLNAGFNLSDYQLVPYEKAFIKFYLSIEELYNYARSRGVNIALENLEHKNPAYMMTHPLEYEEILDLFPDLGVLLDLGHLKIASNRFGFKMDDFINVVKDNVAGIHVHENDGKEDLHLEPAGSDMVTKYVTSLNCNRIIIESRDMGIPRIIDNIKFFKNT